VKNPDSVRGAEYNYLINKLSVPTRGATRERDLNTGKDNFPMPDTHSSATPPEADTSLNPSDQDDGRDRAIMGLLLSSQPPEIWTAGALERKLREPLGDSLEALHSHGLIHCWDGYGEGFVLVSRAVAHYDQMMI
jgi:hypothetical protein